MSRNTLERLNDVTLVALRVRGDDWPRPVFGQVLIPGTWMGLVQKPDGRRRFIPAGEDPTADRDDVVVLVRNRPITIRLVIEESPSAGETPTPPALIPPALTPPAMTRPAPTTQSHLVSGSVEILVRCPAREDDLASLRDGLLSEPELELDRLTQALVSAGAVTALRKFILSHAARELVEGDVGGALTEHLRTALQRALFSWGLVLERLGAVEFRSRTLHEQDALQRESNRRVQQIQARDIVERTALAAAQRRLTDLGDVLAKLKTAATGGKMQWHELLPTLTHGERGRLLESLWRLTPNCLVTKAIVAVSGYECVWLDPAQPDRIVRRATLPGDLGGARSVSYEPRTGELLVGTACGVCRLNAATGEVLATYAVPGCGMPQTGFNAAIIAQGRVIGTHSQLGAWSWAVDQPADARPLLRPIAGLPKAIRAATLDEAGHVLVAADERVHAFDAEGNEVWQTGSADGSIQCLAALEDSLFAGTSTGALLRCDLGLHGAWTPVHRALRPIETVQARRWDDLVELVIPAGPDGVAGVYAGEGIVSRLLHANVPIRRAWASDDALVALTDSRDRLIVLSGVLPDRNGREVPLGRMLGRTIQHACLVVEPAKPAEPARPRAGLYGQEEQS
jgi:hypothetical protein